jgi:hypothetical protein
MCNNIIIYDNFSYNKYEIMLQSEKDHCAIHDKNAHSTMNI